jgi:hypothetical protein
MKCDEIAGLLHPSDRLQAVKDSVRLLEDLQQAVDALKSSASTDRVRLDAGRRDNQAKAAFWIEGETDQRVGQLVLWESGELDMEVIRLDDDTAIVNEHRIVSSGDEVRAALAAFLWALDYVGQSYRS